MTLSPLLPSKTEVGKNVYAGTLVIRGASQGGGMGGGGF